MWPLLRAEKKRNASALERQSSLADVRAATPVHKGATVAASQNGGRVWAGFYVSEYCSLLPQVLSR